MEHDWRTILGRHPLFEGLTDDQIDRLLAASTDRVCKPDEIVFREGDPGLSLFLVGSGEVDAVLLRDGDHRIPIATMPTGEVFGEMALLEQKPRSATVIATRATNLLEIDGPYYLELLGEHPQLKSKMLAKLSDRLRRLTDGVVAARFNELSRKFALLEAKIDRDLDNVKNAQTTAELMRATTQERVQEMSERASEVLEHTSRNQDRLFQAIKVVALVGGVGAIVLAALGFQTWGDVRDRWEQVAKVSEEMLVKVETVENASVQATKLSSQLAQTAEELQAARTLYKDFFEPQLYRKVAVDLTFRERVQNGNIGLAKETFLDIFRSRDDEVREYLLLEVMDNIVSGERLRSLMKDLLVDIQEDLPAAGDRYDFLINYLLYSAYVMDGATESYKELRPKLEKQASGPVALSFERGFEPSNFEIRIRSSLRAGPGGMDAEEAIQVARERSKPILDVWNMRRRYN